jgi:hypothetical protein
MPELTPNKMTIMTRPQMIDQLRRYIIDRRR